MRVQDLFWLPEAPDNFKEQLKALADTKEPVGQPLKYLASSRLTDSELNRLAKATDRLRNDGNDLSPLTLFKIGVVGNVTTNLFVKALKGSALRYGLCLDTYEAEYDQMPQETLDPASGLNAAKPEAIFFALDYRNMPLSAPLGDADSAEQIVESAFDMLMQYRAGLAQNHNSICIFQSLVPPPDNDFGSIAAQVPGTLPSMIEAFNLKLRKHAQTSNDLIFDATGIANIVGLETWFDPVSWHMGKLNFAQTLVPYYADCLARTLAAIKGKTRKALVLDLDNTLWGGVIGDDGMNGITIGQGSALGESYLDIQRAVLRLRERGIVLAVCSKNNDETARQPFQEHPEMLLKEEHISVFQANWDDKATNIRAIAEHLSLGLDALVFLDDNPAERERVRQMLPDVAVPELPEDPAYYSRALLNAGYFETVSFSDDDKKRADYYHGNAKRLQLQDRMGSYEDYLQSLDMQITFQPFDDLGRARIAQLINKTNQFNLTTKRYNEAQVQAFQNDLSIFTLQVRLADKFGDNGMIGVVICQEENAQTWVIDTWLMSCRVLKRKVEDAILAEIVNHAREKGVKLLKGCFIPTAKNELVKNHFKNLGFSKSGEDGAQTYWVLDLASYTEPDLPMIVERSGFDDETKKATNQ